jgi:WXG100 family type VII secretion target
MKADLAVLAREGGNFNQIAAELKTVMGQVEQTGGGLATSWTGDAGTALQGALGRFHEAAARQQNALDEISTAILDTMQDLGVQTQDQTNQLQQQMNEAL